jgi:hypothetical protein
MSTCNQAELLRDYAFDELPASDRPALQRHISGCASCAAELDQLRLTTAALRALPDREPPQRIAFVSDKVFAPSRFRNGAPWLGFASAGVMAAALVFTATHRPVEIRTVPAQAAAPQAALQPIEDVVKSAVSQTRDEDARMFKAELAALETRHDREHRILMDAIAVMQQNQNTNALLAVRDTPQTGAGQ